MPIWSNICVKKESDSPTDNPCNAPSKGNATETADLKALNDPPLEMFKILELEFYTPNFYC